MLLSIVVGVTFLGCAKKRQKVTFVEEAIVETVEIVQKKVEKKEIFIPKEVIESEDLNTTIIESDKERKKREFKEIIENTPLILKNKSSKRAYE